MDKRHYELMYIIPITFAGEALQPIVEEVIAKIKELGGELTREHNLGKMKFAYPIKHNHQGFYQLCEFDIKPAQERELDEWLRLKREILRYVILNKDPNVQDILDVDPEKGLKAYSDERAPMPTEEEQTEETKEPKKDAKKEEVKEETPEKVSKKEKEEVKDEEVDPETLNKEIDKKLDELLDDEIKA